MMRDPAAPIGIFDSGLGGLTVAAAVRKLLPSEQIVYLGDTARVPYGTRSPETVQRFALENARFLRKHNIKLLVAACNTVSSVALETLRQAVPEIPVIGVIHSGVRAAIRSNARSVTVIGTRGTIRSGAYERALKEADPGLQVNAIACPLLVPLAEEGILTGPAVKEILHLYLAPLRKTPPDALLPGCTHYPLFRAALQEYLPACTQILDCAGACAGEVQELLAEHGMPAHGTGGLRCYVTDSPPGFEEQARRFLGYAPESVEPATL